MPKANNSEIWFFNQYASTPAYGIPGRHYYIGRELSKLGFKVKLFAAKNTHLNIKEKEVGTFEEKINSKFSIFFFRTFKYKSSTSVWRIINWIVYLSHCLALPFLVRSKPDHIVYSSPSLPGFVAAFFLAKYYDVKLVFDVRDIWPLTLIELGGFSYRNPLIWSLGLIEKFAYKKSDKIISNLPLFNIYIDDLLGLGHKVQIIPNGIDIEELSVSACLDMTNLENTLKNKFVVGYVGTIGRANAVGTLISAATKIQNSAIHFLIVGNGSELDSIKKSSSYLSNVTFIDAVPKREVGSILGRIDVGYIAQVPKEIYRYGVASIKIPEYLFMGKPVIHMTDFWSPVAKKDFGSVVQYGDTAGLLKAIMKYHGLNNGVSRTFREDSYLYALENYDYKKITEKLILTLNDL